jgi:translation initiation factor 1
VRLFAGTPFDRPPHCDKCGLPEADCKCPAPTTPRTPPEKQTARIAVEKRKMGKMMTVVRGLANEGDHLATLLTAIKTSCGAGGTLKDGELEIQGSHLDKVRAYLTKAGYKVKP